MGILFSTAHRRKNELLIRRGDHLSGLREGDQGPGNAPRERKGLRDREGRSEGKIQHRFPEEAERRAAVGLTRAPQGLHLSVVLSCYLLFHFVKSPTTVNIRNRRIYEDITVLLLTEQMGAALVYLSYQKGELIVLISLPSHERVHYVYSFYLSHMWIFHICL